MAEDDMLIIDDLMNLIKNNQLQAGEKLPSENQLADQYKVPRITVRNALTKLEERGYIYSVHGKGRYVKEKLLQIHLSLTGDTSFTEKMKKMGYSLQTQNIACVPISYDEKIYRSLQAKRDEAVYKIGRLRYIQEEPMAIHYSYVKETNFPDIAVEGPDIVSMFAYYRKQGINQFRSNQTTLSVSYPTLEEQRLLTCKSMVPLLVVETNSVDKETDHVLEYTKILYRSDTFKYDISQN